jgi:uroporphyrinogen decarboxylase
MQTRLKREPDFDQFLKVLRREGTPSYLPFYEHVASAGFIATRTETDFTGTAGQGDEALRTYVDFWLGMGYDCIPMERGLRCPLDIHKDGHNDALSHGSEASVVIRNREDFERYPWPDESEPIDFTDFEKVAAMLPDGVKVVGGVAGGPYEWAAKMMGTIGMSYLMVDDPELVGMVFAKIGSLHVAANRILAQMDFIGAHRQGDDLGFKTSTFLPPDRLREWVFPTYREMVNVAHGAGRPFILHSCGNLAEVYDDLADCGIDAKHSFEDVILPVAEFKQQYGDRMTPLGGLDVDFICRASKEEIRRYTIEHIETCWSDGYWALGTGNSLTNYMPVENYITALETAIEVTG